jgi:hypothetical protein
MNGKLANKLEAVICSNIYGLRTCENDDASIRIDVHKHIHEDSK